MLIIHFFSLLFKLGVNRLQYFYEKNGGDDFIKISGDEYKYLFRVKRVTLGDFVKVRNLADVYCYNYEVIKIDRKKATLILRSKKEEIIKKSGFHIGWCIIDPKVIDRNIHILNELGVEKISFIYCDRSQKNFKLNFERLKKILISSSMQCGRIDIIELEIIKNIDSFIEIYKDFVVIDFGGEKNISYKNNRILIGTEGGFSEDEKNSLNQFSKLSFRINSILRSETAVICATSKILA